MVTGPILLAATLGASVSFLLVVFFNLLRERQGDKQSESNPRPNESEIWE